MNIAHIVFEIPLANGSGGDLRNRAIDAGLKRAATTRLISVQSYLKGRKKYPARKKSFVEADIPKEVLDQITQDLTDPAPDLVVIDGVYLIDLAEHLLAKGFRVAVNMHNVESLLRKDMDQSENGWRRAFRYRSRWKRAVVADQRLARSATSIWMCSPEDAAALRKLAGPDVAIKIVPNPLPPWSETAKPRPMPDPWPVRALYVGHLGYGPNVAAAKRLMTQIFPRLSAKFPDATLTICGRDPARALWALAKQMDAITLVPDPPDVGPFYADATVALVPLRQGGGTRLKILEAMAVGLPVVATPKAIEGINIAPDEGFLLAKTDGDFVRAVARLSSDKDLRNRLIENGRKFALETHGQASIDRKVGDAIAATMAR